MNNNSDRYYKGQNIIVTKSDNGLNLFNPDTKKEINLDLSQAELWINYNEGLLKDDNILLGDLYSNGFIIKNSNYVEVQDDYIDEIPVISGKYIKWNFETPDLYILFNSKSESIKNPFILFGPYGSMCWKKIIDGCSIKEICDLAQTIFGDSKKAIYIIKGLIKNGYIEKVKGLEIEDASEEISEFTVRDLLTHVPRVSTPWWVSWEICSACDLNCKHCYMNDHNNLGFSTEKSLYIVNELIESNVFQVVIMGGEPLLRKDLEEIIRCLKKGGIYVSIITNGQTLTLERARSLMEAGVGTVFISFDGCSKDAHEMIRGQGTFDKSVMAIHNAKKAGIPRVAASWAINDMNFNEYKKLPEFLTRMNISECYMEIFKKTGLYGSKAPFNPIGIKEVGIIKEAINKWKDDYPRINVLFEQQCSCGRTRMKIADNGDVFICIISTESSGNIFDESINKIWKSMESKIPLKGPAGFCKSVRELYLLHIYG